MFLSEHSVVAPARKTWLGYPADLRRVLLAANGELQFVSLVSKFSHIILLELPDY